MSLFTSPGIPHANGFIGTTGCDVPSVCTDGDANDPLGVPAVYRPQYPRNTRRFLGGQRLRSRYRRCDQNQQQNPENAIGLDQDKFPAYLLTVQMDNDFSMLALEKLFRKLLRPESVVPFLRRSGHRFFVGSTCASFKPLSFQVFLAEGSSETMRFV